MKATLEKIEFDNQHLIKKMTELAQIEGSKSSVISAVFIRKNDELRFNNMIEIQEDIKQGAKTFGQQPENYAASQDSIIKAYVEQINKFMKTYNQAYINIKTKLRMAEENQKILMIKSQKLSNNKQLYIISNNANENILNEYNKKIDIYKNQIKLYENIISRCDSEFENCKLRREKEFKELFENEKNMIVPKNENIFKRLIFKIGNKFNGYENFSKYVLQKYATKINQLKTSKLDEYIDKIKKDMVIFSNEIDEMLE